MNKLIDNIKSLCSLTVGEIQLITEYFNTTPYSKNSFFLKAGQYCNKVAFVDKGVLVYTQNLSGKENVCDFAFEGSWVTQYKSLTTATPSEMSIQAIEDSVLIEISAEKLQKLTLQLPKINEIRMKLAEASFIEIAQRTVDLANLSAEHRYSKLLQEQPHVFQLVPLSYIASFLGITQRHLSRLRSSIK